MTLEYDSNSARIQIDAAAEALRAHDMKGRITQPWSALNNSTKRKWREKAMIALRAAGLLK